MLGLDAPGDQKVSVPVRNWTALRLALWRSKVGWGIVERSAIEVLSRCLHTENCPGAGVETEPCLPSCPDRELRMDALVILSAARTCSPVSARQPANEPYFAPSREYFSEVITELETTKLELEAMHEALRRAGVATPAPPPNESPVPARAPAQLEEKSP
jgi:hypothetical protein